MRTDLVTKCRIQRKKWKNESMRLFYTDMTGLSDEQYEQHAREQDRAYNMWAVWETICDFVEKPSKLIPPLITVGIFFVLVSIIVGLYLHSS